MDLKGYINQITCFIYFSYHSFFLFSKFFIYHSIIIQIILFTPLINIFFFFKHLAISLGVRNLLASHTPYNYKEKIPKVTLRYWIGF